MVVVKMQGSSPHTRGALRVHLVNAFDIGIIPAYAGSTSRHTAPRTRPRDHPRIRGEHGTAPPARYSYPGSSPHTRGALIYRVYGARVLGIIPAYAGSTYRKTCKVKMLWDHPRIRGEHITCVMSIAGPPGSSPHTRGARLSRFPPSGFPGIIPAYAGSTCPISLPIR